MKLARSTPRILRGIRPQSMVFARQVATSTVRKSSNPQLAFPCLDHLESKQQRITQSFESGPEPSYGVNEGYKTYHSDKPLYLDYGGVLPEFDIGYETWGELNEDKSNGILIHTGLSASSHAKSHPDNPKPGWWEKFIGPGLSIDTDKYFVVCTNVLGGCYGSTGPSSIDPASGKRYATSFPIVSINDMVRGQNRLIRSLGIKKLHASVGSSMGGMQSLAYANDFSAEVDRVVSVSGCARSHPYSIAMRHVQRQILMSDANWKRGNYYDSVPPHVGMKLAREVATITYRSGPEWEQRFGRDRADPTRAPALCPDFLIETYLDHAGEKFCLEYDANSLLYVSKGMDLFDLGVESTKHTKAIRARTRQHENEAAQCPLPDKLIEEQPRSEVKTPSRQDLVDGVKNVAKHKVLVIGIASDILFPSWQQKEIAEVLRESVRQQGGNEFGIHHIELGEDVSMYGHDTFLLDVENVGGPIKRFLEH
ncbi:Alpha/Beta hydrolase protein [Yarrowia lipolytica]|uniref:YALI0C24233p n=2 Tax=Yarrowia lipolytica TaxID=4952 RepID=Q6CAU6_YARLI|nr:YALI0C24233p [Yarrowia lipolytica CLIB122]AOW03346.1 hypothetical protein YALI1_C33270g [Yarrowia lipolytica]KAB8280277.1 Alpha/Beta hydrolase protein [Yarrowia lipolytica]KAE8169334.1 Alpha/Beta hydrolase protein [Yarrowia lipolytica]KAJ8053827.1 Alpha/Beta hydrolase protein [Yarrowia lipolytica]RDW24399.1 Alpha/Beta hydrolase protein [Yarrowia lipolytica]|eukprot:XP_502216.1 YALI0C24233p [Yarrowia lipolytica CLIB122]